LLLFRDSDSGGSDCWDSDTVGSVCSYSGIVIQRERLLVFIADTRWSHVLWCLCLFGVLGTDSTCMFYQAYPVDFIEFIGFFEFFFFSFHAHTGCVS